MHQTKYCNNVAIITYYICNNYICNNYILLLHNYIITIMSQLLHITYVIITYVICNYYYNSLPGRKNK